MVLFFSCLALIEYETCLLYKAVIEKTEDLRVRLLLFNILAETKKHKGVLEQMSKIYGQTFPPKMVDCNKTMGKVFKESIRFARSLRRKSQKGLPLLELMEKLVDYEKVIGEEYATIIYSQLKILETREAAIKKILEYMVVDEKSRSGILKLACLNPDSIAKRLFEHGIVISVRGGGLRISPHFYNTEGEIHKLLSELNAL